jgi:hypothetical protein
MKAFKDLEFKPHPTGLGGVQAIIDFDNGRGASVVCAPFSYGGKNGLYELAIFHNDDIDGDVKGWLTEDEVTKYLIEAQEL